MKHCEYGIYNTRRAVIWKLDAANYGAESLPCSLLHLLRHNGFAF